MKAVIATNNELRYSVQKNALLVLKYIEYCEEE